MTLLQNRSGGWGSASVVAAPAAQLAGWKDGMELLGTAGGSTAWHVGLCPPASVLYGAKCVPFPPRLTRMMLTKPLSTPFPLLPGHHPAPPAHGPEELWLLWLNVTIGAQRYLALALQPSTPLLPALPAPGTVRPPLPIPSLCLPVDTWCNVFPVSSSSAIFLGFQC